jgi:hypothetical protein
MSARKRRDPEATMPRLTERTEIRLTREDRARLAGLAVMEGLRVGELARRILVAGMGRYAADRRIRREIAGQADPSEAA